MPKNRIWTEEEIEFLRAHYPERGKSWCMQQLGRKENEIRSTAGQLGLRQDQNSKFFKEWQERARLSKIGKKRPDQSKFMKEFIKSGRVQCFVKGGATAEQRKAISERTKKQIRERGHPRGFQGGIHTAEARNKMSIRSKLMWQDPNNYVNSAEYRQILSDRAAKFQQDGTFHNRHSRAKMGHYEINGKKMFFRSRWEANYALYLDFLIKQKQIQKWEYEVDTFWFEEIRRGTRSYKPDFKILNLDNSIEYHEVKGWMDSKSRTKLARMKKYHPSIKIVLIEEDSYKDIKNKLGRLIGFFT